VLDVSLKQAGHFSLESLRTELFWYDDFLGDQLGDEWGQTLVGAGSVAVVDAVTGGVARLTTGAVTQDDTSIHWTNVRSLHVNKLIAMEARVLISKVTVGTLDAMISLFFDSNNQIQFVESGSTWFIYAEDGGATTQLTSGVAMDTDFHIYRIEAHLHGGSHVHYYIDGVETANSPIAINIPDDAADFLQPRFFMETTEAEAKYMDIDYVGVRQNI